jgi:hypothetical protein
MNHDPNSRILERHYLELMPLINLTAGTLDERQFLIEGTSEMVDDNSLTLTTLNAEQLAKTQGHVLNALCREMAAVDPEYPWGDAKTTKLYDKRIRRVALQSLLKDQHRERRRTETIDDVDNRRIKVFNEATTSAQRLIDTALQTLRDPAQLGTIEQSGADERLIDEDFPEQLNQDPVESDVDDPDNDQDIELDRDQDEGMEPEPTSEITYEWAVEVFMMLCHTHSPCQATSP